MAVSGSKDYSITTDDIMLVALRRLGVLDPAETVDATEEANAELALNLMVKEWSAQGISMNLRQRATMWITDPGDKAIYTLGPSGDAHASSWAETELSSDASASDTTVTVDTANSTHYVDTANIIIQLDNGDLHATTINGAPSGTTATLTDSLPSAASTDNRVYSYATSSQGAKPVELLYVSRITVDTTNSTVTSANVEGTESEVEIIGLDEYQLLSTKKAKGPVTQVYYEPRLTTGLLHIWPTGTASKNWERLNLVYTVYADDFDADSDNPEFPIEWGNVLSWGLAAELASEYGISPQEQQRLWATYRGKLEELLDHDVENSSVIFARDARGF